MAGDRYSCEKYGKIRGLAPMGEISTDSVGQSKTTIFDMRVENETQHIVVL